MSHDTDASKMVGIAVITDTISTAEFAKWRIVPNSETLLFNFSDIFHSEDDAIELIVRYYGRDIMGVRRLVSRHITNKNWIIIETCFVTDKVRLLALKNGVMTDDGIKILPVTTCNQAPKYTLLTFSGMALFPTHDQIKSSLQKWSASVINNAKTHCDTQYNPKRPLNVSIDNIEFVWMQVDHRGFYNGKGGVVIRGYDHRFTTTITGSEWAFPEAYDYPNVMISITGGQMFCINCHTVDDHETSDCTVHPKKYTPCIKEEAGAYQNYALPYKLDSE
ncbi:hypothetical protein BJV82DRAFT_595192 [Fennellomyces sp. T-0311]|nr:hypothetical protein BJV82DRAFT_595192 [Fennellomyces sp. T-0311]